MLGMAMQMKHNTAKKKPSATMTGIWSGGIPNPSELHQCRLRTSSGFFDGLQGGLEIRQKLLVAEACFFGAFVLGEFYSQMLDPQIEWGKNT